MSNVVEETRKYIKDDEGCVGDYRSKWICLPGPHHPGYFQNYCVSQNPNQIFDNRPGAHWKVHLPNRKPLTPFRTWMVDRRGFRQDDWFNAPNDCAVNKDRKYHTPYYSENCHALIPRSEELTDFWSRHPGRLLQDFVYRKPDYYLRHFEETRQNCSKHQVPGFKEPSKKKISERCVMRLQFAANNYHTIDDGYAVDFNH